MKIIGIGLNNISKCLFLWGPVSTNTSWIHLLVTVVWGSSWSLCWPLSWRATRGSGRPLTGSSRKLATFCPRKFSMPSVLSPGPTWGFMSAKTQSRSRKFTIKIKRLQRMFYQICMQNFFILQNWTFFKHRPLVIFWTDLISSFWQNFNNSFVFNLKKCMNIGICQNVHVSRTKKK